MRIAFCSFLGLCCLYNLIVLSAEPPDTNYDESKVPHYDLPPILVDLAGNTIENRYLLICLFVDFHMSFCTLTLMF